MIGVGDVERVDADLNAGVIACPGCGAALRPCGYARPRRVRDLASSLTLRPRRAPCGGCGATHVLPPGTVPPRRAEQLGATLRADAASHAAVTELEQTARHCNERPTINS